MSQAPIKLWVDDIRPAPEGWHRVTTVTEAIRVLDTMPIEAVSLDYDISHKVSIGMGDARPFASDESFEPVARFIAWRFLGAPLVVILHTANSVGAEKMATILKREGFDVEIRLSKPCNRFESDAVADRPR